MVLLFLSLISLGQAYPFSFVYALGQEDTCSCHRAGHECMHGCPRKGGGHCCHHGALEIGHSQDKEARVSNLPCGGKTKQEILSFRGDPFLPAVPEALLAPLGLVNFLDINCQPYAWRLAPELPPPRGMLAA